MRRNKKGAATSSSRTICRGRGAAFLLAGMARLRRTFSMPFLTGSTPVWRKVQSKGIYRMGPSACSVTAFRARKLLSMFITGVRSFVSCAADLSVGTKAGWRGNGPARIWSRFSICSCAIALPWAASGGRRASPASRGASRNGFIVTPASMRATISRRITIWGMISTRPGSMRR